MLRRLFVALLTLTAVAMMARAQNSDPYSPPGIDSLACPVGKGPPAQGPHPWVVVSAGVMARNRIGGKDPKYPSDAKRAHVEGRVVLKTTISDAGKVEDLCVIQGPEMLQQAAFDAVKKWKYRPFTLNGQAREVKTQMNVDFALH